MKKGPKNGFYLKLISAPELLDDIPENKFLLDPILKEQSLTMIYAYVEPAKLFQLIWLSP